ncbi:MAG TPA: nucleotide exchange factor GrpE [Methylomirabilota bacterium]|nr:nucleotide exchange factor GrpE [Methylomirabilota bacterium]
MSDEPRPLSQESANTSPSEGAPSDTRPDSEVEHLRLALEEKTREADAHRDRALRALADLDNYKRRVQRDREGWGRYAIESLVNQLLPVLDNFDRALQAAKQAREAERLVTGVDLIRRELLKALELAGITPYSALGERFDPEKHEAVSRVETDTVEEFTVIDELRPGYLWNGKVFRPAQVSVAVKPPASGREQ